VEELAGALIQAIPKIFQLLKAPFSALEIARRYKRRRVRIVSKDGTIVEGTLRGQGLVRHEHTLLVDDDRGNEHSIPHSEISKFVAVRKAELPIRNPGRAVINFGLFFETTDENLPELVEKVLGGYSRVQRREPMPTLVAFQLLDSPWESASIEVGEPMELTEAPLVAEPPSRPTFDSVRGTEEIAHGSSDQVKSTAKRLRDIQKDIASRTRVEGRKVGEFFYLRLETDDPGIANTAVELLHGLGLTTEIRTVETILESDGLAIFIGEHASSFAIVGPAERLLDILR